MARRTNEARVAWKHLAFYGVVVALVALVGVVAIWSFLERQSLVIRPDPLPKITIVTSDARSRLAAAWVRLLTKAELTPTLVPLDKFDPIEGVVVFCDVPHLSPQLAHLLDVFVHKGGAIAFVGVPPDNAIGHVKLTADVGPSDSVVRLSETVSPLLARLNPGYEFAARPSPVALLRESPRMVVDARWRQNSRAVIMHLEDEGARFVWMGLDPDALLRDDDRQLQLLLRTAFRWVAGQPVSDGAVGQDARSLTPDARREAREGRFAFSVDRMTNSRMFSVRMTNRGTLPLDNPTVKIWLPPRVSEVRLAGDLIMKRGAELTGVPEEGACLLSLPSLTRGEDRVMKIRIVERRGGPSVASR